MMLVDSRVGSKDLVAPLRAMGLSVEQVTLEFGDLAWEGRGLHGNALIGVELKNVADLINSLRSNRLPGHQLPGLQRTYAHRWLFVEGVWRVDSAGMVTLSRRGVTDKPRMSVGELEERLTTLAMLGGLRIRHTPDRDTTLHALAALYRWWTDKAMEEHNSHVAIYQPQIAAPVSQFRQTAMTLPGVGRKTSTLVERHFGTLRRAFAAGVPAWMAIEGIGARTAARIQEAIDGKR